MPNPLATLNAILNALATLCLVLGWVFIRRGQRQRHRMSMLAALGISVVFLISYLVHHAQVGSVPFRGTGALRGIYFAILIPHVLLAAAVGPLALVTLVRARRERFDRHRAIARVTLPIWLYVSVSGVLVYVLLYHVGR